MRSVMVVLFAAAFRLSGERGGIESPNISHALREDGQRTVCGRVGWVTEEGQRTTDTIDCLSCRKGLACGPA